MVLAGTPPSVCPEYIVGKTLSPEQARDLAQKRWQHDNQGLDEYIDKLVKRAPALTQDQRDRLATLLRPA
jgi:hypothetical protein